VPGEQFYTDPAKSLRYPLRSNGLTEGLGMFTSEQYRAKAGEYAKLAAIANGPYEVREFQRLERSFTQLADNAQWVTDNHGKMVHATEDATEPVTPDPRAQSMSPQ
jgi:hypothetical protein